jgi:alkylmercury lyase-like protein
MIAGEEALSPVERRLHRALLDALLRTGAVPSREDLAGVAGIAVEDLTVRLAALEAADYVALTPDGRVGCLYPFSLSPTPHIVVVGERRRYAMCAIDALGIAAILDQRVAIEGGCAACGAPIRLGVTPGTIARAEPPEAVVLARRSGDEPAWETCCPFTLFACGPAHGHELAVRLLETTVVSLEEALHHAETIFGSLLGETLPARRRRSLLTTSRLRT